MSNPELKKYNDCYSELLTELTKFHNNNIVFVETLGRESGYACRKSLRKIIRYSNFLRKENSRLFEESLSKKREEKKLKKEKLWKSDTNSIK